jgi:1-acyl-sn-glycerol-3-phosphate acyltransferase
VIPLPSPSNPDSGLPHLLSRLRGYLFINPLIWLYTVVMGTFSLLSSFFDKDGSIQHWFAHTWSRMILKTIFSPITVEGLDHIQPGKTYVFAASHGSAMDIPMLYSYLPGQFRIMAKKELFVVPFMGWHLKRSGQISIDQSSARSAIRSLSESVDTLKQGMSVMIFPEGGRSPDGTIQPFMPGAFYAAIKAGVEVVPIALVGLWEILPMNTYHIKPGPIRMIVGQPVGVEDHGPRDADKLSAMVQQQIEELYYGAASVPDPRKTQLGSPAAQEAAEKLVN